MSSFFGQPVPLQSSAPHQEDTPLRLDFLAFLAICFEHEEDRNVGLHPVTTTWDPSFDDVSMNGHSFEVRKVKAKTFPQGLQDHLFKNREFVVVKHQKLEYEGADISQGLSEIATELQILRHRPLREHEHIIDFLGVMYHDAGTFETPNVLPALVIEHAAFGSVKDFQENGYGRSFADKVAIITDTAKGLEALHECGIIHGDIKSSNLLACKHPTRPFTVKLADFGFSFSMSGGSALITGYTSKLEAPEASEPVDPYYLRQLDIYSYGILLHTIFKNGTPFFEFVPEDGREETVKQLKTTNLLVATQQLNLLNYFAGEKNMGLILCKILAYTLQKLPARRFKSMSEILALLSVGYSSIPAASLPLNPEAQIPMTPEMHAMGKAALIQQAQDALKSYCTSFSEDDMPMIKALESALMARAREAVDLLCKSAEDWEGLGPYSLACLAVLREIVGGLKPMEPTNLAGLSPSETASTTGILTDKHLKFSEATIPDFPNISVVLHKCPAIVQDRISSELQGLVDSDIESPRRSHALLGLAWAYAEGFGHEYNLEKSLELTRLSAELGNVKAQQMLLELHYKSPGNLKQEPEVLEKWLHNITEIELPRSAAEVASTRRGELKEVHNQHLNTDDIEDLDLENEDVNSWFSYAMINDDLELARRIIRFLDKHPATANQELGKGAPLMLACRSGSPHVVMLLLDQLAEWPQYHRNDVQPQHWLFMFEEERQEEIGKMMVAKGADLNSWIWMDPESNQTLLASKFLDLPREGTPMHWALIARSPSTVATLLKLGADPLLSYNARFSPFGLACYLSFSEAVKLFLHEETVQQAASNFLPLDQQGKVLVQPLFWTLQYEARWNRLLRNGVNFEDHTKTVIELLVKHGSPTDAVLRMAEDGYSMMTGTFATAYHNCSADVLRSGLENGFQKTIDSKFGGASSGGTPLFLAITHHNREVFTVLLEHGAKIRALDNYKFDPLLRACKETDDTFFIQSLIKAGVDPKSTCDIELSPFAVAVRTGNLKTAQLLYDDFGFEDHMNDLAPENPSLDPQERRYLTTLGYLIHQHTRSALRRIQFLLSLPDRSNDGFIVMRHGEDTFSALHVAVPAIGENPDSAEVSRLIMLTLLQKYNQPHHINSTKGPHQSSVLGMAVEYGNYKIVAALLHAGADPNVEDEYGRMPLDQLYWRYCYPATTEALKSVDVTDRLAVQKTLTFVNHNTSEILSLLTTYGAKANVFQFPEWHRNDSGYRGVDWVIERLKENQDKPGNAPTLRPVWGDLPIRIPEKPMQFKRAQSKALNLAEGSSTDKS